MSPPKLENVIGVRMAKGDVKKLEKIAEAKGLKLSQLVRMILKEWLGGDHKSG